MPLADVQVRNSRPSETPQNLYDSDGLFWPARTLIAAGVDPRSERKARPPTGSVEALDSRPPRMYSFTW
jgi:hypothetical protein